MENEMNEEEDYHYFYYAVDWMMKDEVNHNKVQHNDYLEKQNSKSLVFFSVEKKDFPLPINFLSHFIASSISSIVLK